MRDYEPERCPVTAWDVGMSQAWDLLGLFAGVVGVLGLFAVVALLGVVIVRDMKAKH